MTGGEFHRPLHVLQGQLAERGVQGDVSAHSVDGGGSVFEGPLEGIDLGQLDPGEPVVYLNALQVGKEGGTVAVVQAKLYGLGNADLIADLDNQVSIGVVPFRETDRQCGALPV